MRIPSSVPNRVCQLMGAIFVVIAIWGCVTTTHVLIFGVNAAHNIVHLVSGLAAIVCGIASFAAARAFWLVFGAVYGLVALLGFRGVTAVIDVLHLNDADNRPHVGIALVFLTAGITATQRLVVMRPA